MTAAALLETLQARGISARVEDGNLKLRPARVLDSELIEAIRCNKSELLQLLQFATASTQMQLQPTVEPNAQTSAPLLPLSLAGIPGIEYSIERDAWVRRIDGAVWLVPLLDATADGQTDEYSKSHQAKPNARV